MITNISKDGSEFDPNGFVVTLPEIFEELRKDVKN